MTHITKFALSLGIAFASVALASPAHAKHTKYSKHSKVSAAAVKTAMAPQKAKVPAKTAKTPAKTATTARNNRSTTAYRRATGRSVVALSTAYNSLANQTDSTPFITATGTRTRPGVVAMSRDMLRIFPYGTRVRIEDLSGRYPNLKNRVFIVEDTMHARKRNQVDIWMRSYRDAMNYGRRQVRITAIR